MNPVQSACTGLIVAMLASVCAHAGVIYAPGDAATSEGPQSNCFPFRAADRNCVKRRYQQVFDASLFSSLAEPTTINSIAFRADRLTTGLSAVGAFEDVEVRLSTTARSSATISSEFEFNVGSDEQTVFDGTLAYSITGGPAANAFDFVIAFTNPFVFDPSAGNLLFDWRNFGSALGQAIDFQFDSCSNCSMGRVFNDRVDSTSGPRNRVGLVAQFAVTDPVQVPAPAALVLLALGIVGLRFR